MTDPANPTGHTPDGITAAASPGVVAATHARLSTHDAELIHAELTGERYQNAPCTEVVVWIVPGVGLETDALDLHTIDHHDRIAPGRLTAKTPTRWRLWQPHHGHRPGVWLPRGQTRVFRCQPAEDSLGLTAADADAEVGAGTTEGGQ